MGRPKGKFIKDPLKYQVCIKCEEERNLKSEFFSTNSAYIKNKKHPVCKKCLTENLPPASPESAEYLIGVKDILREINKPFIASTWQTSIEESERRNFDLFGCYMKNIALLSKSSTSKDTDNETKIVEIIKPIVDFDDTQPTLKKHLEITEQDKLNEEDVLRLVGYDPFESESYSDKKHLYNRLIDFLDEGTLEDNFKLSTVIEIAICFRQIDKINNAISKLTDNAESLSTEVGKIKSLFDTKEKMLKSVLALAKDNGISVNHNNNKSKGGNTLNGIVKKLNEIGLEAAEINLFDLETCEAMKQIADFSNRSILDQLMLDENDYTSIIAEQKELINKIDGKLIALEEENRLLKIKIKQMGASQ